MPGPKEVQPTNPDLSARPCLSQCPTISQPSPPRAVLSFQGPGYLLPCKAGAGGWSQKMPERSFSASAEPQRLPASAATLRRQKSSPDQKLQEPARERV